MKTKFRPRCFFDIDIGRSPAGRIVFELYNDICPKTTENFEKLCTGELKDKDEKPLHYLGSPFHRVIKGFMIQGGDFTNADGTGGESIYGGRFEDENFSLPHDKPFLLSMANCGPNTNGSQFFITTKPTPHLDGKHVVFGHVVSGENLIESIENLPVNDNKKPVVDATIKNCGRLVAVLKKKLKKEKAQDQSDNSDASDKDKKHKKKKSKKKNKKKSKLNKKSKPENEEDEINPNCSVRPDEIPEVPKPYYLYRGNLNDDTKKPKAKTNDVKKSHHTDETEQVDENVGENEPDITRERKIDHAGRTTKGRGVLRYRPSPIRGDETPPHWRKEERSKAVISSKQPSTSTQNHKSNNAISKRRFPSSDLSEKDEKENHNFVSSTVEEPYHKKHRSEHQPPSIDEKLANKKTTDKPEAHNEANRRTGVSNAPKEEGRRSELVKKTNEIKVNIVTKFSDDGLIGRDKTTPNSDYKEDDKEIGPSTNNHVAVYINKAQNDEILNKSVISNTNEAVVNKKNEVLDVTRSCNKSLEKQMLSGRPKSRESVRNRRERSRSRELIESKRRLSKSRELSYDRRRQSRSRHRERSKSNERYGRSKRRSRSSSNHRRTTNRNLTRKSKSPPAFLVERWRNRRNQIRGPGNQLRTRRSSSNRKIHSDDRKNRRKKDSSYRHPNKSRRSTGTVDSSESSSGDSSRINKSAIVNVQMKEKEKSYNGPKDSSETKKVSNKLIGPNATVAVSQPQPTTSTKPLLILKQKDKPLIQNQWKDEDSNEEVESVTAQKSQSILEKLKKEDEKQKAVVVNSAVEDVKDRVQEPPMKKSNEHRNSSESRSAVMSQSISKLRSPSGTRSPADFNRHHASSSSSTQSSSESSRSSRHGKRRERNSVAGGATLSQQQPQPVLPSRYEGGHRKSRDDTNRSSSYHKRPSRRHHNRSRRSRSRSSRSSRSSGDYRRSKRSRSSRRSYGTRSRSRDRRRDSYSRSSRSSSRSSDGSSRRYRRYRRSRR